MSQVKLHPQDAKSLKDFLGELRKISSPVYQGGFSRLRYEECFEKLHELIDMAEEFPPED